MAYWLLKSEPDQFSWDQQVENRVEPWTGVRSHQAKRNLQAMRRGDRAFFYHSNIGKEIVGIVEVVREAYPDPSAGDQDKGDQGKGGQGKGDQGKSDWVCVDVEAVARLARPVTLAEIKASDSFSGLALVRQSRLSVVPVSEEHWAAILTLAGGMS